MKKKRRSGFDALDEPPPEILGQVVKHPELYTTMKTPGALQPSHLFPPFSGELVLFTLPDVMNPLDLIHSEVVVGGQKESVVMAAGQKYRMSTHVAATDNTSLPCLFLPDQDGHLTKVTGEIKACLVMKGVVEEMDEEGKGCVDIDALRSVSYKAPRELQRRDFFTKFKAREVVMETQKPVKRKKNAATISTKLENSLQSNGDVQSPGKKKKSKHATAKIKEEMQYHMKNIKQEHSEPDIGNMCSASPREKKKGKRKQV